MSHANPDKKQPEVLGGHVLFEGLAAVEAAARAAFSFIGRGDNKAADHAAVEAMRSVLKTAAMKGRIVIGEGERDEAPMLYIGETVGTGEGEEIDIAVDPLEGTTLTAKAMPNALCVMALSRRGGLLHAPDTYMDKIALGPGWPEGVVDLDASVEENLQAMAKAKGVSVQDLCICFLERPRHADAIEAARGLGARVRLIPDGDVAGIVYTTQPETGVDLYMGRGGAPEGVLAAAALKAIGGQMQARLYFRHEEERERAHKTGLQDLDYKYTLSELASGPTAFLATGVTSGDLVDGVRETVKGIETETLMLTSWDGTQRIFRTLTPRI